MRSKIDQYLREQNQPKSDDTADTVTIKAADLGISGGGTITGRITSSDPYAVAAASFNSPGGPLPTFPPPGLLSVRCTDGAYVTAYETFGHALHVLEDAAAVRGGFTYVVGDGGHVAPYELDQYYRHITMKVMCSGQTEGWVHTWRHLTRQECVYTAEPAP